MNDRNTLPFVPIEIPPKINFFQRYFGSKYKLAREEKKFFAKKDTSSGVVYDHKKEKYVPYKSPRHFTPITKCGVCDKVENFIADDLSGYSTFNKIVDILEIDL